MVHILIYHGILNLGNLVTDKGLNTVYNYFQLNYNGMVHMHVRLYDAMNTIT